MGPSEQAYAPQIHFLEPKMSRAANFLNQEVTFIFGTVENGGNRKVKQIEITLEFHDPFNQVVLRDTQRLFLAECGSRCCPGSNAIFKSATNTFPRNGTTCIPRSASPGSDPSE